MHRGLSEAAQKACLSQLQLSAAKAAPPSAHLLNRHMPHLNVSYA